MIYDQHFAIHIMMKITQNFNYKSHQSGTKFGLLTHIMKNQTTIWSKIPFLLL
jgi:hypothetical protein